MTETHESWLELALTNGLFDLADKLMQEYKLSIGKNVLSTISLDPTNKTSDLDKALEFAIEQNNDKYIKLLRNHKTIQLAEHGRFKEVIELIHQGADINCTDASGISLASHILMYQPYFYEEDDIDSLPQTPDQNEIKKLFDYLIENGLDINHVNPDGHTLLTLAMLTKNFELADTLINKGLDIDAQFINDDNLSERMSALVHIINFMNECDPNDYEQHSSIFLYLIQNDANLYAKNKAGETALELAQKYKLDDVANILTVAMLNKETNIFFYKLCSKIESLQSNEKHYTKIIQHCESTFETMNKNIDAAIYNFEDDFNFEKVKETINDALKIGLEVTKSLPKRSWSEWFQECFDTFSELIKSRFNTVSIDSKRETKALKSTVTDYKNKIDQLINNDPPENQDYSNNNMLD